MLIDRLQEDKITELVESWRIMLTYGGSRCVGSIILDLENSYLLGILLEKLEMQGIESRVF